MNHPQLIQYMLRLSEKEFDRFIGLYRTYNVFGENEKECFLGEQDGVDVGVIKEIHAAERIHGPIIRETYRERGQDISQIGEEIGFVLADIKFRRRVFDPDQSLEQGPMDFQGPFP